MFRKTPLVLSALFALHSTAHAANLGSHAATSTTKTTTVESSTTTTSISPNSSAYSLADHLAGTADLVTNYVSKGVSQTGNGIAPQAGITYSFDSGFYLNLWGSAVNFQDNSGAATELDYIAGYKQAITEDFSVNVFGTRYIYPHTNNFDYNEYSLQGIYKIITATVAHSANEFNSGHSGTYYNMAVDYPVPSHYTFNISGIGVGASAGHFQLPAAAGNSYDNYRVYISKDLTQAIKLILNYTDTSGANNAYSANKAHIFLDLAASF